MDLRLIASLSGLDNLQIERYIENLVYCSIEIVLAELYNKNRLEIEAASTNSLFRLFFLLLR